MNAPPEIKSTASHFEFEPQKLFFYPFFLVWLNKSETHYLDKVPGERKKGHKLRKVFLLLLSLKDQPWAGLILPIMHCPNTGRYHLCNSADKFRSEDC